MQETISDVRAVFTETRRLAYKFGRVGLVEPNDICQEAMIRVLRSGKSELGKGWLFKVVRSVVVDARRRMARDGRYLQEPGADLRVSERIGNDLLASDSCVVRETELEIDLVPGLKNVLAQLSKPARQVLLLYAEGWSYKEIAELTNANVGTVRSRLYYARKRAKEYLSELG
jgi:RNA polymerase sigma factor, sigma-70 family